MPSICGCPRCHRVVQILSLADAALELRCPHCAGTFAVSEIAGSASAAPRFARPASEDPAAAPDDDVSTEGQAADAAPWSPETSALGFGNAPRSRSSRGKSGGVLGPLIGIVLGGVVGISIGYVILIWVAGRSGGDVLHVLDRYPVLVKYLPGADR